MPGFLDVHEHLPAQRTVLGRLVFESALVIVGLTLAGLSAYLLDVVWAGSQRELTFILALLAAGVGTSAVGLGQTAGRITGNRRAAWLIPALALYSLDIIPDTALHSAQDARPGLGLLVDSAVLAGLLAAGIRPPARCGSGTAWLVAGGCMLLGTVLEGVDAPHFGLSTQSSWPAALDLAVALGWCTLSTAVVAVGYRTASAPLWRAGLGFAVIAAAHVLRRLQVADPLDPSILFSTMRLFGVVVVTLGLAQLLRRALHTLLAERFAQEEELRVTSIRAQEVARAAVEREHELRNGLSGLAGVTRLLNAGADDDRSKRARSAAITELHRLSDLLDRRPIDPANDLYSAGEVVEELVELWRMTGMGIDVAMADDLMVVGRAATLAQVLTNLLINCGRHAPGSAVHIVGFAAGPRAVIQIRDDGAAQPQADGARSTTEGEGLGMEICRRLLRDEAAALRVEPPDPGRPGFTVTVELRRWRSAADASPVPGQRLAVDLGTVS
jgi:two-component system, OmpR family, sensor kinase